MQTLNRPKSSAGRFFCLVEGTFAARVIAQRAILAALRASREERFAMAAASIETRAALAAMRRAPMIGSV